MNVRREPNNLVWWLLVGGLLLGVLIDNPLHWDAETLREREQRGSEWHGSLDSPKPAGDTSGFSSLQEGNQHVETRSRQALFPWLQETAPRRGDAGSG
ncbi:MAG: hypothetical protein JJT90_12500 [Ectothiorhodospiraceae bacterium]|nr:hypothetical protein [Ectothiorhodospiraceae bacterium]